MVKKNRFYISDIDLKVERFVVGGFMIIWVDGANGVGKSSVAAELAQNFADKKVEHIESDLYWIRFVKNNKNNLTKLLCGFFPYNNKFFLAELRDVLEEKLQLGKTAIVSMALVDKSCEMELLDYFDTKKIPMVHIILEASKAVIIQRIKDDYMRNQNEQTEQMAKVEVQIEYLKNSYANAIRVNIENGSIKEIVDDIKACISEK